VCREHFEALESDFQRYYDISLGAAMHGPAALGARRLVSLATWLPPEAAIWRATSTAWTTDHELQALTIEMLDSIRRLYMQAHVRKGTKLPQPVSIPRPWNRAKERPTKSGTTLGEMIAAMGMQVRRGGEG
jgi:hypothetical protein